MAQAARPSSHQGGLAERRVTGAESPGGSVLVLHLRRWWPAWLLTGILGWLILYPLVVLFRESFRTTAGVGPTLANYVQVFAGFETYQLVWTTLWLAVVRVALATLIGVFLAWSVTRTDVPGRGALEALVWVKFFAPPLPIVMAWVMLGGKTGLLNTWLTGLGLSREPVVDVYSYAGIIWVSTLSLAAFIFLLITPAFRSMDTHLEEAARVSGASRMSVLRFVTLPVLRPSIVGAVFLSFVFLLESFEVEMMLGAPRQIYVLSTRIFVLSEQYPPDFATSATLSSLFLLAVGGLVLLQMRVLRGKSFVTVSGKSFSSRITPLGKARWSVAALCWLYVVIAMVVPLTMLVVGSFMRAWGLWRVDGFTLQHWQSSLGDPRLLDAVRNTVVLGVLVGITGTAICAAASYLLVRTKFRGRGLLEFITWAPRTAPGIVLAVAFASAYIGFAPFRPLLGTLGILVIILVINGIPLGSRITNAAAHQVAREMEEAALISGASWFTTCRRVLLPLMAPSLVASFVLLFLGAIRNLVLVIYFYSPNSRVLSAIFWEGWIGRAPEQALVAGLLMMGLSLLALAGAMALRKRVSLMGA